MEQILFWFVMELSNVLGWWHELMLHYGEGVCGEVGGPRNKIADCWNLKWFFWTCGFLVKLHVKKLLSPFYPWEVYLQEGSVWPWCDSCDCLNCSCGSADLTGQLWDFLGNSIVGMAADFSCCQEGGIGMCTNKASLLGSVLWMKSIDQEIKLTVLLFEGSTEVHTSTRSFAHFIFHIFICRSYLVCIISLK